MTQPWLSSAEGQWGDATCRPSGPVLRGQVIRQGVGMPPPRPLDDHDASAGWDAELDDNRALVDL